MNYYERKERARQKAIEWQLEAADKDYSYGELIEIQAYFTKIGKYYGLLTEFRENAII